MQHRLLLPYDVAEKHILDGDIVLYRPRDIVGTLIQKFSGAQYSHVGMAAWDNGHHPTTAILMTYAMLTRGGTGETLRGQVEKWPGAIDIYRVSDSHTRLWWDTDKMQIASKASTYNRGEATFIMRRFCRPGNYGYMSVAAAAIRFIPGLRWLYRRPTDDQLLTFMKRPDCSQAVSFALRKSFTDIVVDKPDMFTEPADFAQSPLLHYLFSLDAPLCPEDATIDIIHGEPSN